MTKILNETSHFSGKELAILAVLPCISLLNSGKSAVIVSVFLCIFLLLSFFVLFLRQFFFSGEMILSLYFSILVFIASFLYMIFPIYLEAFFVEKNQIFLPFFSVMTPFFIGYSDVLTKTYFWIRSLKITITIIAICCGVGFLREVFREGKFFGVSLSSFGLDLNQKNHFFMFFELSVGSFFLLVFIYWILKIKGNLKKTGKKFYVW